jgi:uncharacterized repeat protein (TIGR02543 family)
MEIHLDNPAGKSIGAITKLAVKFNHNVIEWDLDGDYVPRVNMPFSAGDIPIEERLRMDPPSGIYDDANDHPRGDFNAHFGFNSLWDYTGAGGSLVILNFKAKRTISPSIWHFGLSVEDVSRFLCKSWIPGIDYVLTPANPNEPSKPSDFPESAVRYGDVNGDGSINQNDLTMLRNFIAASDWSIFLQQNPDFNVINANVDGSEPVIGSGIPGEVPAGDTNPFAINAADLSLLRQYLWVTNPYTVHLGPPGFFVSATHVSVSPSRLDLEIGQRSQLTATVFPTNATNRTVSWRSTDTSIASVDNNGRVTAHRAGIATIVASSQSTPSAVTATPVFVVTRIPVTGISLSQTSSTLNVSDMFVLTATITPSNATNRDLTFTANPSGVIQISSAPPAAPNGRTITAISPGRTTITVRSAANNAVFATAEVVVTATITWNGNGGIPTTSTSRLSPGNTFGTQIPTPTRTGHSFIGWYNTSANTGGTRVFSTSTVPHNNAAYWARWVSASSSTTVTVDLFAEQFWRERHGALWGTYARELFDHVRVPFLSEFSINLVPTAREINLPGQDCTHTIRNQLCSFTTCGGTCYVHHKNIDRALDMTDSATTRNMSLALVGYNMCMPTSGGGNHRFLWGMATAWDKDYRAAVSRGFFQTDLDSPQESFWTTIRVAQHEISHNYNVTGHDDCTAVCVMNGGFLDAFSDRTDIWCNNCRQQLNQNRNRHGG